jgi:hypothetical protein
VTVEIPLTHGLCALVDDLDVRFVQPYTWWALIQQHTTYAVREIRKPDARRTTQRMHTLLTGYKLTDHINGDGLDNRRANLRPANSRQNTHNRRKMPASRSRYKGICLHRPGSWQARLRPGERTVSLGYFTSEEAAARAYDAAAREAFGEFACLNFPLPGERGALR